jgi:hypothetical protein
MPIFPTNSPGSIKTPVSGPDKIPKGTPQPTIPLPGARVISTTLPDPSNPPPLKPKIFNK